MTIWTSNTCIRKDIWDNLYGSEQLQENIGIRKEHNWKMKIPHPENPLRIADGEFIFALQEIPLEFSTKQKAPHGCAVRGEEISCFATPLAREEFASELFIFV